MFLDLLSDLRPEGLVAVLQVRTATGDDSRMRMMLQCLETVSQPCPAALSGPMLTKVGSLLLDEEEATMSVHIASAALLARATLLSVLQSRTFPPVSTCPDEGSCSVGEGEGLVVRRVAAVATMVSQSEALLKLLVLAFLHWMASPVQCHLSSHHVSHVLGKESQLRPFLGFFPDLAAAVVEHAHFLLRDGKELGPATATDPA